jgi:hypothetical protein
MNRETSLLLRGATAVRTDYTQLGISNHTIDAETPLYKYQPRQGFSQNETRSSTPENSGLHHPAYPDLASTSYSHHLKFSTSVCGCPFSSNEIAKSARLPVVCGQLKVSIHGQFINRTVLNRQKRKHYIGMTAPMQVTRPVSISSLIHSKAI